MVFGDEGKGEIYKDISSDHWAYKAVEELSYKEIFDLKERYFFGEHYISRYELANYLYKMINSIDKEKASSDDFLILQKLIYEFSNELSKYGLDNSNYSKKIKEIIKTSNVIKNDSIELIKKNKELEDRIKKIEYSIGKSGNKDGKEFNFNYLDNIELTLENRVNYLKELNENDIEGSIFRNSYKINVKMIQSYFDLEFESSNYNEGIILKIDAKKEILKDTKVFGHTKGYNKFVKSYSGKIAFSNYYFIDESLEDGFNSYGIGVENPKYLTALEFKSSENINYIAKFENSYISSFFVSDVNKRKENRGNDTLLNYELYLKYRFNSKLESKIGYSKISDFEFFNVNKELRTKLDSDINLKNIELLNIETELYRKDTKYDFIYERKRANESKDIYNLFATKLKYGVNEEFYIDYKIEYIQAKSFTDSINYFFLINSKVEKLAIYLGYNYIIIPKNEYNSIFNGKEIEFESKNSYNEILAKLIYEVNEKLELKIGYNLKNYESDKKRVLFMESSYNFNTYFKSYLKYVNSNFSYDDYEEDINGVLYNIDFNLETGILGINEKERVEVGLELKF